jgi:hypothetical protein
MSGRYYTTKERKHLKLAAALGLSAAILGGAGLYVGKNLNNDDTKTYAQLEERLNQPQNSVSQLQISKPSGLEEKITSENKQKAAKIQSNKPIDAGIVVSSNENLLYAQLNIEILKNNNYTNAYLEKIKHNGKNSYRVIVGVNYDNIDSLMNELKTKNLVGDPKEYFRVRGKEITSLSKESPKQAAKRDEKINNEFRSVVNNKSRDEFVGLYAPVVKELYTGQKLSESKVKDIVGYVYDADKEFKVPLMDHMGIIAQESIFGKILIGDRNRGSDYSYGLGHILMGTLEDIVYPGMRNRHVSHIPDTFHKFLQEYKCDFDLQARSSAFYFRLCLEKAGHKGNSIPTDSKKIKEGAARYNEGLASDGFNRKYTNEIEKRKREMEVKRNHLYPNSPTNF